MFTGDYLRGVLTGVGLTFGGLCMYATAIGVKLF